MGESIIPEVKDLGVTGLPNTQQVEQSLRAIHAQIIALCEALDLPKPPSWT